MILLLDPYLYYVFAHGLPKPYLSCPFILMIAIFLFAACQLFSWVAHFQFHHWSFS